MELDLLQVRALLGANQIPFFDNTDHAQIIRNLHFEIYNNYDQVAIELEVYDAADRQRYTAQESVNPLVGLFQYQTHNLVGALELQRDLWDQFIAFSKAAYRCFDLTDATKLLLNVIITQQGQIGVVSAQMHVDDNALFRHPEITVSSPTAAENIAFKHHLNYVKLGGQIGCMTNGAGLAMTIIDMIAQYGSASNISAANFLDIGGGARADRIPVALRLLLDDTDVQCVLLNIFGGITRCDEIARSVVYTYANSSRRIPLVIRLKGTNASEAQYLIENSKTDGLLTAHTLTEAVEKVVDLARDGVTNVYSS